MDCPNICKPTAHELSYDVEIKKRPGGCHDNNNDNRILTLIRVEVQGRIQVVEELNRKTVADVLAEIGGYLGLFVGISVVTMLEFFLFVFWLLFDLCSSRCKQDQNKTEPDMEKGL